MSRPQFAVRTLLLAMPVAAAFFGGMRFERVRQRRENFKKLFWNGGVEYWPPGPEFKLQRARRESRERDATD